MYHKKKIKCKHFKNRVVEVAVGHWKISEKDFSVLGKV